MASDKFSKHEALDPVAMIADIFDRYVVQNPAVQETAALRELTEGISDGLGELYQACGREFMSPEQDEGA